MILFSQIAVIASIALLASGPVAAQSGKSLAKCEKAIGKEMTKYAATVQKAVAKCMDKVAKEVLDAGDPIADAAKSCASALRKLENTEDATKTLSAKFQAKVAKVCDPNSPGTKAAHDEAEALDPNQAGGIQAGLLDAYCGEFGGDGTLDTTAKWIACANEAAVCNAMQQVAVEYPRASNWLGEIASAIGALGADAKYIDGQTAANAARVQIDANLDGVSDIACGAPPGPPSPCGNGTADDAGETCDGPDLRGLDCADFGFEEAGGLACTAECRLNLSGCETSVGVPAVIGEYSLGYQDNGDGTVTDLSTGLMWEKKTDDDSIHDKDDAYSWSTGSTDFDGTAKTAFLDVLNDVAGGGASCFAGHCDWRLPSMPELKGILLEPESNGACATAPCINQGVFGPTASSGYWSATPDSSFAGSAWFVFFVNGFVGFDSDTVSDRHVRAVRGGL